jgi:carboxylesterase type B
MATSQSEPVWRYHFADRANFGAFLPMGAFHAWELFYVFDAFETGLYLPSDGERQLARLVQRSWGRLARFGDPNGPAGVSDDAGWPAYEAFVDDVFQFDEDPFGDLGGAIDVGVVADPAPECDLWDRYAL